MRKPILLFLCFCTFYFFAQGQQNVLLTNPSDCGLNLSLLDENCPDNLVLYDPDIFTIDVQNAPGTALGTDVYLQEVRLIIEHAWIGDLQLELESPSGENIVLLADVGASGNNFGTTSMGNCQGYMRLAAAACISIDDTSAQAPFLNGPYRPQQSLFNFNDESTDPNGQWKLKICDDLIDDSGTLQYVELVFAPLNCLPVSTVEVMSVDTTTVVLDWSPEAGCSETTALIEYGPPGFTPGDDDQAGEGTLVVAGCPPFALTGLAPETEYDLYIRKSCSTGSFSGNSCGTTIATSCDPPAPRTTASFDTEATCTALCDEACPLEGIWRNQLSDQQDWLVYSGATPTAGTGPTDDVTGGGNYVYLEASGTACAEGGAAILQSGCFDFQKQGSDRCHFSFSYHMYGVNTGSLRLEVSDDGGVSWEERWARSGDAGNRWNKVYLDMPDIPDGTILQFRFVATKGNGARADIALDEITTYGSLYLGQAANRFFADTDNDGFGDEGNVLFSCLLTPPQGYVADSTDCDDTNPNVNPASPEIPCDNLDNNCNGIADDFVLPSPLTTNDTICSGDLAVLRATAVSEKFIFWYTDDPADDPEFGALFTPDIPANNGPLPVSYTFFAEETDFVCFSDPRAAATVLVYPRPQGNLTTDPSICPGQTLDLAALPLEDINLTGAGVEFFNAPLSEGGTALPSTEIQAFQDTSFFYRMTNSYGCTYDGKVDVRIKNGPQVNILPNDSLTLCVDTETTVELQTTGGVMPLVYQWSTGADSPQVSISAADGDAEESYRFTVTDSDGCSSTDSIYVRTVSSIDSIRRTVRDVSSCSGADGQLVLTPLSGVAPYRYQWSGTNGVRGDTTGVNSSTYAITDLPQGAYRVTITDSSSDACAFRLNTAYVNGPDVEVRAVNINDLSCPGASDGSISLQLIGSPDYLWSTGATTATLTNLAAGTYSLTLTEGDCQTILTDLTIEEPAPLGYTVDVSPPSCFESSDGTLELNVTGGRPAYQIIWSTGAFGSRVTDLRRGAYSFTITDQSLCTLTDSIRLIAPDSLQSEIALQQAISCASVADGQLRANVSGGTAPYSYAWDTGSTAPLLAGLSPGTYRLTITDFNGCSSTTTYTLTEPDRLQARILQAEPPVCVGDTSGRIEIAVEGGTMPYQYQWQDGVTTAIREKLGVGEYLLVASDANGCTTDTLNVTLEAVSDLRYTLEWSDAACAGVADGRIAVIPGGLQPFSYQWADGSVDSLRTELPAGDYPLTLTDAAGCQTDTLIRLLNTSAPIELAFDVSQPKCAGGSDGLIDVQIIRASNLPLNYSWSDGVTTRQRQGIAAGVYELSVTDQRGCAFEKDSILVEAPEQVDLFLLDEGAIECRGEASGYLELGVRGGIAPYEFNWVDFDSTGNAVYDIAAGTYRVFVTDANDCPADSSFQLQEPPLLSANLDVDIGNVCLGDTTNRIAVQVSGGVAPYRFDWTNGATDSILINLQTGDYSVAIIDANNCREELPAVKIRQPGQALQLVDFRTRDISCFGRRDGRMQAAIDGGQAPYRFLFSNGTFIETFDSLVSVQDLPANQYSVSITDARGCSVVSDQALVEEPDVLRLRRDSIDQLRCFGSGPGSVYVTATGGTQPFAFNWYNEDSVRVATTEDLRQFMKGTYYAIVTDSRLCKDTLNPVTLAPTKDAMQIVDTSITHVKCKGEQSGAIAIDVIGGKLPYTYQWGPTIFGRTITNLSAGMYSVTVADADTCQTVFTGLEVREPATAISIQDTIDAVSCAGRMDGAIAVGIEGGHTPYEVSWELEETVVALDELKLENLQGGSYVLKVGDQLGCRMNFNLQVPEPAPLSIDFERIQPSHEGVADGQLTALASGGTPDYQYHWNTGDTLMTIGALQAGQYTVSVTDANDCQLEEGFLLMPVAVLDHSVIEEVRLYPNPAVERAQLQLQLSRPLALRMQVSTPSGQLVRVMNLPEKQQQNIDLHLENLKGGWYVVQLWHQHKLVYTSRLILN